MTVCSLVDGRGQHEQGVHVASGEAMFAGEFKQPWRARIVGAVQMVPEARQQLLVRPEPRDRSGPQRPLTPSGAAAISMSSRALSSIVPMNWLPTASSPGCDGRLRGFRRREGDHAGGDRRSGVRPCSIRVTRTASSRGGFSRCRAPRHQVEEEHLRKAQASDQIVHQRRGPGCRWRRWCAGTAASRVARYCSAWVPPGQ